MKTNETTNRLLLPALRAFMGDWVYYSASMKMGDIADRVAVAEEIHKSKVLSHFLQRAISGYRTQAISSFLLTQEQRFFNSLVLGVYGGMPQWLELSVKSNQLLDQLPKELEGSLGLLHFEGNEKLFAIDGQHRVVGIREAVKHDEELKKEDISCIFVGHSTDEAGQERTRRLFTVLNRYAKPVSKLDIIVLDEDDTVAICTRALLERDVLPDHRISRAKTKNVQHGDSNTFTTLIALYDALDKYLRDRKDWIDFKKVCPSEEEIEKYIFRASAFIEALKEEFGMFRQIMMTEDQIPSDLRSKEGGHLLFRPVGLSMVADVIRELEGSGIRLKDAARHVSKAPMDLTKEPWRDLLWDSAQQRMMIKNQSWAVKVLYYCSGGDLSKYKTSPEKLTQKIGLLMNRDLSSKYLQKLL